MRSNIFSITGLTAIALSTAAAHAQLFGPPVNYPASSPNAVTVADMNNDGVPDLVTAGGSITILLGNGDGTFTSAGSYGVGGATISVAAADLNGDGNLDVVATRPGTVFQPDNKVAVLFGNGDGTLGAPTILTAGSGPASVKIEDLNGDGLPDLAVANRFTPHQVSVFFNEGGGVFGAPLMLASGNYVTSMSIGDVTGNGALDMVITSQNNGTVYLFPNDGAGSFDSPMAYFDGGLSLFGALGDLTGNGYPDFVTTNGINGTISVLMNGGEGGFDTPALIFPSNDPDVSLSGFPQDLVIIDVDQDGVPDLVLADSQLNAAVVHLGNGDGTFSIAETIFDIGAGPRGVATGDFNGDGLPDVAITHNFSAPVGVTVLLNQAVVPEPCPDANGDGVVDLGDLSILLAAFGTNDPIADFNGDGVVDLSDLSMLLSAFGTTCP